MKLECGVEPDEWNWRVRGSVKRAGEDGSEDGEIGGAFSVFC